MRVSSENAFLSFLQEAGIPYQYVGHPPVYTCEQADQYRPAMPGVSTKNLFLTDKKGRGFYLVVTDCEKKLNLKNLGNQLAIQKLHFASEQGLEALLGVTPGAVTLLGLVNDTGHRVTLYMDADIWGAEAFLCHPLVNTATLLLAKSDLERFLALTGHIVHVIEIQAADGCKPGVPET